MSDAKGTRAMKKTLSCVVLVALVGLMALSASADPYVPPFPVTPDDIRTWQTSYMIDSVNKYSGKYTCPNKTHAPVISTSSGTCPICGNVLVAATAADWLFYNLSPAPLPNNQVILDSYRYNVAFQAYYLALIQYQYLPAWHEKFGTANKTPLQTAMKNLIGTMTDKRVWQFWKANWDPTEWDPILTRNIMLSGHLSHMVALYEMLFNDHYFDGAGTMVFDWADGNPAHRFPYSNYQLQHRVYTIMAESPEQCARCEPDPCFSQCNLHPQLGLKLYVNSHPTQPAGLEVDLTTARNAFTSFFWTQGMINANTEYSSYYNVTGDYTVSPWAGNAWSDGWIGFNMLAWADWDDTALVEGWYDIQKGHRDTYPDPPLWPDPGASDQVSAGFFAMYAAEKGDSTYRDEIVAWADSFYDGVLFTSDSNIYYAYDWSLRSLQQPDGEPDYYNPYGINLTERLFAIARADAEEIWRRVHFSPRDSIYFASDPYVRGVDYPKVLLRRASYNRAAKRLYVDTTPGYGASATSVITVGNAGTLKTWAVYKDGIYAGTKTSYLSGTEYIFTYTVSLNAKHNYMFQQL
jgi:hypothetical protein